MDRIVSQSELLQRVLGLSRVDDHLAGYFFSREMTHYPAALLIVRVSEVCDTSRFPGGR